MMRPKLACTHAPPPCCGPDPLDVASCAGDWWPHSSLLFDAVGPSQDALDVEAAKLAVLPPFQSVMELTSAAAPPQRGVQPETATSGVSTAGRSHNSKKRSERKMSPLVSKSAGTLAPCRCNIWKIKAF